jgi:hypothetical protein
MPPALLVVAAAFALLGLGLVAASWRAWRRRRVVASGARALTGLLFAALAALAAVLSVATQGYRAFTREEVAAEVTVRPDGPQAFVARFRFADGRVVQHRLAGDQLYVDAHILKWTPLANVLGLHTAYELDRVAGRYASLDDERTRPRTVESLGREKTGGLDLFELRRRWGALGFLVDAEYGSATFFDVRGAAVLEVRVSTTGLLVRPRNGEPNRPR